MLINLETHVFTNTDRCDRLCVNGDMRDIHYYQWAWWSYCFQDVTFRESLTKLHCICYFPNALQAMFGDSVVWLEYWMCYWLNWWLTRLVQCWFHAFISSNDQPRCYTTQLSSLMTSSDCLYCIPAVMCYSHWGFACMCVSVRIDSSLRCWNCILLASTSYEILSYQLYMSCYKTEWHIATAKTPQKAHE